MFVNKKIMIRRDPTLFLETRKFHKRAMKKIFLKSYKPLPNGGKNRSWTLDVDISTMTDLRIHLSWVIGMKVFHCDSRKIGKKILKIYKRTGELKFLLHVIKTNLV
jgi:hypothetical protein